MNLMTTVYMLDLPVVSDSQSALMLAASATSVHFLDSEAINRFKSSGVPIFAVALSLLRLASTSLPLRISLIAALSFSTVLGGVPAGARMADQNVAWSLGIPA